jgi:hypothetical protein
MASHEWTRVVLLRPAVDSPKDARLNAIFAARDWFAIEHTNPYQAMTELCLRERAQAARAAWGLQRLERSALVILDSEDLTQFIDLVQAVKRHLPATSIWKWSGDDLEPLVSGQPATIKQTAAIDEPPIEAAPKLQISPDSAPKPPIVAIDLPQAQTPDMDEEPVVPAERISREEIDMLLRTESDDSGPMPLSPARRHAGGSGRAS